MTITIDESALMQAREWAASHNCTTTDEALDSMIRRAFNDYVLSYGDWAFFRKHDVHQFSALQRTSCASSTDLTAVRFPGDGWLIGSRDRLAVPDDYWVDRISEEVQAGARRAEAQCGISKCPIAKTLRGALDSSSAICAAPQRMRIPTEADSLGRFEESLIGKVLLGALVFVLELPLLPGFWIVLVFVLFAIGVL